MKAAMIEKISGSRLPVDLFVLALAFGENENFEEYTDEPGSVQEDDS